MKRIRVITKSMSPKTKATIRAILTSATILLIVILFVGLVVGLSLGLKDDDSCDSGWKSCGGNCKDIQNDFYNCGNCGAVCSNGSTCLYGSCNFCPVNCSEDGNMCTVEPCNDTMGCTPVDCDNDGDFCTTGPCDPETGCTAFNCTEDNNVCTSFPCDPATGCTELDCNNDGDECTEAPCHPIIGCAYVCPILLLSPPNVNFSATYKDDGQAHPIGSASLTLTSSPNIGSVAIKVNPILASSSLASTSLGPLTENYNPATGDYSLTGTASAGQYQTALRGLRYTVPAAGVGNKITFAFTATNDKPLPTQNNPTTTITYS